jgi:sugar phosphate isomerase/epimerase
VAVRRISRPRAEDEKERQMALRVGLIGIVGRQMQEDLEGTLRSIAEMGYEGVEGAGHVAARLELPLAELRRQLDAFHLAAVAQGGVFLEDDEDRLEGAVEAAVTLGAPYVVSYWGPCESRDGVLRLAEWLDRYGARCREAGLQFCYHNHNHELAVFDGGHGLDLLAENTDPDNVKLELDVAWLTYGGVEPAATIRRYAGRCPILHVKDLAEVPEGGETSNDERGEAVAFTEVGTGVVDVEGVVAAARDSGVEWLVVEQDRMRELPPMASARVSCRNLKRIMG